MDGGEADASHRIRAHDARLQLGDFGERGVDRVLDRADLGGDFVGGIFDHLFAHDCSFPGASRRSGCRSDLMVGCASS